MDRDIDKVIIHTDSASLIGMLGSPSSGDVAIHYTLGAIREIGQAFTRCKVLKVGREHIRAAHDLANEFRTDRIFFGIF